MVTFKARSIEHIYFSGCSRTRREKSRRQPMTNFNAIRRFGEAGFKNIGGANIKYIL
jgi:hypothetical protein